MKNKAAAPTEEHPTKRTKLFDEDAVSDDEAVNLTINEDFAKRFEHNKKREEKQKRNSRPSNSASYMSSNVIQSRKSTRTKTLTKTRLPMRMKTMPPN
jgi:protein KRI1